MALINDQSTVDFSNKHHSYFKLSYQKDDEGPFIYIVINEKAAVKRIKINR